MEIYKALNEKIEAALSGKSSSLDFYQSIWTRIVHLNSQERQNLIEKAEKLNEQTVFGRAALELLKGMSHVFDADFLKAIDTLNIAKEHFISINEYGGIMSSSNLLSISFRSLGQLDKAQVHLQVALKAAENVSKESIFRYFKAVTYYQAGELNTISKNYIIAREYYEKGMQFVGDVPELEGRLMNGLGNMLMQTDEWESALDHFNRSLLVAHREENPLLESKIFSDIGNFYFKKKDYVQALENQNKSLDIRLKKNFINPSITNYINLAEIHLAQGKPEEAIRFGMLAAETAAKLNVLIKLYEAHEILAKAYENSGDASKAFEHFKQYHKYREEVHNRETIKKIEQLQTSHKVEIMEQEKEIFRLKNVELKSLLDEIQDSFRYARRIQISLLPTEKYIARMMERLRRK